MVANAVHYGHRTHKWDPRMRKYLHGEKGGIHVFNLELTLKMLNDSLDFMKKSVSEGKTVLFVSTKPQAIKLVEETAKDCGMPYVVTRWIPGLITNFGTIKKRIKYLKDLKEQEATGEFDKYTKKEAERLFDLVFNLKCNFAGRGLWQLGTSTVDRFGGNSLLNCWFTAIKKPEDFYKIYAAYKLYQTPILKKKHMRWYDREIWTPARCAPENSILELGSGPGEFLA